MRYTAIIILTCCAIVVAVTASGIPVIDVGHHVLQPNTPGQKVAINVIGSDQVSGFQLRAQIGDGLGPNPEPVFSAPADFTSSILNSFPAIVLMPNPIGDGTFYQSSISFATKGTFVTADGQLVLLEIDTTGFEEPGIYELKLKDTQIGQDTDFSGNNTIIDALITNGTISIGPVPLPGDFDSDGDVDGVDLAVMFANFNGPGGGVPANPATDLDGDGDVDGVDLAAVFGQFTGPLGSDRVPEPSSLMILGLVGFLKLGRR